MASQLRLLISGSSGLVGSALRARLADHCSITRLVRRTAGPGELRWDPLRPLDPALVSGFDAVVHLAGENVASGYWTKPRMARIRDSRVLSTRHLSEALAQTAVRPRVLVAASAIGYYGNRGDEVLTESSGPGDGFLAVTSVQWEGATALAGAAGIRVVNLRIGVALSGKGGALAKMLTPFRLGLGARLGDGRQWMSWIALEDLVRIIDLCLRDDSLSGAINVVAPNPIRHDEFAESLGKVLHRPVLLRVPASVLRLLAGTMADEALLASERVLPARLEQRGFQWNYRDLEPALRAAAEGKF